MTNEELLKIREKYNSLMAIKNNIEQQKKEKAELEEDVNVIRYLQIIQILESDKGYSYYGVENETPEKIVERAVNSVRTSNTNNIYVYMGTFINNYERDIVHGTNDYRVSKDDPRADYREYKNLELSDHEFESTVKIPIKDCEEFETKNIVIYPYKTRLNGEYYYKLKNEYFKEAIEYGQEKALEKILRKVNMKKGKNY